MKKNLVETNVQFVEWKRIRHLASKRENVVLTRASMHDLGSGSSPLSLYQGCLQVDGEHNYNFGAMLKAASTELAPDSTETSLENVDEGAGLLRVSYKSVTVYRMQVEVLWSIGHETRTGRF